MDPFQSIVHDVHRIEPHLDSRFVNKMVLNLRETKFLKVVPLEQMVQNGVGKYSGAELSKSCLISFERPLGSWNFGSWSHLLGSCFVVLVLLGLGFWVLGP